MLSPLSEDDRDLILPWRNAPEVRQAMYSQHEITEEEHRAWFASMQADPSREWFLYRDEGGPAQGVVYLFDWDRDQRIAFWGFYARPEAPPGTGLFMAEDLLRYAFEEIGLHKLCCEVLATNWQVVNLHEKVGFRREGNLREQFWDGEQFVDVIRFGILQQEWPSARDFLAKRLEKLRSIRKSTEKAPPPRAILILSARNSWMNPYLEDLRVEWSEQGHRVRWAHDHDDLGKAASVFADPADSTVRPLCFCLGYDRIVPRWFRDRCEHTLVVHESDLPAGKGWSPLTWQILEGRSAIPVTLLEAADEVDSGPIYAQQWMHFEGHELINELRAAQAATTHDLCRAFVDEYPRSVEQSRPQIGKATFYPRRCAKNSQINLDQTLGDQVNQLRVVDNHCYPAFFWYLRNCYQLSIEKLY